MPTFVFLLLLFTIFTPPSNLFFFFFNDTATTEIYTLSLHDALPISAQIHGDDGHACRQPALAIWPLETHIELERCPADAAHLQYLAQRVVPAAGRREIALHRHRGRAHLALYMQGVEWQAHSPVEPFLDQVVDHLEIARVKDDAGRIAMAKQHLHLADEGGGHGARSRHLAQHESLQLAGLGARQGRHEDNGARVLVGRNAGRSEE